MKPFEVVKSGPEGLQISLLPKLGESVTTKDLQI